MAKRKLKFPVPESDQIWNDAMVLLQYAYRLEKKDTALDGDEAAQLMLSDAHQAIETFRDSRKLSVAHGSEASLVARLAEVYKNVVCGKVKGEAEYRKAILKNFAYPLDEGENPNDPDIVPRYFLLSKKMISSERGPLEAAAMTVADHYGRGARQLMEYRSRVKKGKLKFRPLESIGIYMPDYDFIRAVLVKIISLEAHLAGEIADFLKNKSASKPWRSSASR